MSERRASEVLNDALELMSEGWCHDSYAVDYDGNACDLGAPGAAAFCALGAVKRIGTAPGLLSASGAALRYLGRAAEDLFGVEHADEVNDSRNAHHTGRMFLRAIELAEADEARR